MLYNRVFFPFTNSYTREHVNQIIESGANDDDIPEYDQVSASLV